MRFNILAPIIRKIFKIFLIVFVVFILVFTIFSMNVNKNNDNGFLGRKFFVVLSDSMKPEFQAGDIVITKKLDDPNNLKSGDIITFFEKGGEVVTHQIQEKITSNSGVTFITKGINSEQADEDPVPINNIIGQYSFSIPKAGHLINFLKTPLGYILFILIPFLSFVIYSGIKIYRLTKEYKKEKLKKQNELQEKFKQEQLKSQKLYEELQQIKNQFQHGNNG